MGGGFRRALVSLTVFSVTSLAFAHPTVRATVTSILVTRATSQEPCAAVSSIQATQALKDPSSEPICLALKPKSVVLTYNRKRFCRTRAACI